MSLITGAYITHIKRQSGCDDRKKAFKAEKRLIMDSTIAPPRTTGDKDVFIVAVECVIDAGGAAGGAEGAVSCSLSTTSASLCSTASEQLACRSPPRNSKAKLSQGETQREPSK